jgi:hypothetical protein
VLDVMMENDLIYPIELTMIIPLDHDPTVV